MKRLLVFWILLLSLSFTASAYLHPPGIQYFFPRADSVYLARVTAIHGEKVSFVVTETLRGNAQQTLVLTPNIREKSLYATDTDWLLVSISPKEKWPPSDSVDILVNMPVPWIARKVTRDNGTVYVHDYENQIENGPSKDAKFMTLDQIKQLLAERPYKP